MSIELHPQLKADCYQLGYVKSSILLLHKNALIPWFILVPDTNQNEIFKLEKTQQLSVHEEINSIAHFVEQHFKADKINIATIGNIVPQLHVHIIARHTDDFCWPNPVWGQTKSGEYSESDVLSLKQTLVKQDLVRSN